MAGAFTWTNPDAGRAIDAPLPGRPGANRRGGAAGHFKVSRLAALVQGTEQKLAELFGRDLSQLDLLAIFIDGI